MNPGLNIIYIYIHHLKDFISLSIPQVFESSKAATLD